MTIHYIHKWDTYNCALLSRQFLLMAQTEGHPNKLDLKAEPPAWQMQGTLVSRYEEEVLERVPTQGPFMAERLRDMHMRAIQLMIADQAESKVLGEGTVHVPAKKKTPPNKISRSRLFIPAKKFPLKCSRLVEKTSHQVNINSPPILHLLTEKSFHFFNSWTTLHSVGRES